MANVQGMDTAAIRNVGTQLQGQADVLAHVMAAVSGLVDHALDVWQGQDAHDFQNWWISQHRPQLQSAHDALSGLGQSAANNAADQEGASGVTSGGATVAGVAVAGTAALAATRAGAAGGTQTGPAGTQAYSAQKSIDLARGELHTTRPTGWDQPGECVKSVQRWIDSAGGHFGGGGPVSSYQNSGAVSVDMSHVRAGDVLQFTSTTDPNSWGAHVHTVLVAGANTDGTYDIIQSNADLSGTVTEVTHWTPRQLPDWQWNAWRFAANP